MNGIFGLLLAVAMLCGGCASIKKRSEELNEAMQSWIGRTADEIVAAWGPPDRVTSDESGGRIFIYDYSFTQVSTGSSHVVGNSIFHNPSRAYKVRRNRMFWVSTNGIIYHWSWRGL